MVGKKKQKRENLATFRRITLYDQIIASGRYPNVEDLKNAVTPPVSEATLHRARTTT